MSSSQIVIRDVWDFNVEQELKLISQCLRRFPLASFDTEFPGSVFTTNVPFSKLSSSQLYELMKNNVNSLKLIQLGLTLSDFHGNLPTFGTEFHYVWQFNFHGFNPDRDRHNPEAITLLKNQGIDFDKHTAIGINPHIFALKFHEFGLGQGSGLRWITFHGLYDYGYLIRILTGRRLPYTYEEFMMLKVSIFGITSYDARDMGQRLGLYGGLEKIAQRLNVERAAGKGHQAGSDSLLTMQVFFQLIKLAPAPIVAVNSSCNVVSVPYCNVVPVLH